MNVKQYLSLIGRKGGLKRAQHPRKRELAIHAANTRWNDAKRVSKPHATALPSNPNKLPSEKEQI